jgi:hypothetical protein
MICKDPKKRSSAMDLLDDEWFAKHGIASIEDGVEGVRVWLESAGFKDEYATFRVPSSSASASSTGSGAAAGAGAEPVAAGAGGRK